MNNTTPAAIGADDLRADLINDLRVVFDSTGAETPQIVRDVIEYADSWLSVYVQRRFDQASAAQPPEGYVIVPIELAERVRETISEFLMDHDWRQRDMDTSDDFDACITAAPKGFKANPGPQAQTLEEAVADVGKWLNERPNRPLDLRSVAMLVAAAQQPREPLSVETLKRMHHEDQFGLFCDYDEFEQIAREIESAHGITVGKAQI